MTLCVKYADNYICKPIEAEVMLPTDPCANTADCDTVAESSKCLPPTDCGKRTRATDITVDYRGDKGLG